MAPGPAEERDPALGNRPWRTGSAEWVKVTGTVTATSDGRYKLTYRRSSRGVQLYRVWNDGNEPESRTGVLPYFKEFKLTVHR